MEPSGVTRGIPPGWAKEKFWFMQELDRERILKALKRLSELLKDPAIRGEICLLGGTAMVVAFKARPNTKAWQLRSRMEPWRMLILPLRRTSVQKFLKRV